MSNNFTCTNTSTFSLHNEKVDVGIAVGAGLGVGFIVCTLFIYYRFIRRDRDGHHPVRSVEATEITWLPDPPTEMSKANEVWYKKKAVINVLSIIINAIQLSAFAFAPSVPWSNGSNSAIKLHLVSIFNAFLVQWDDQLFKITFWVLIGLAALFAYLLLPCSGLFMVMCKSWVGSYNDAEKDKPVLAKSSLFAYKMVAGLTLTLDLFGLSIMTLLFTPLNCTYYENALPTLDIDPTIICWQGPHLVYAACAIVVLVPLYTWSMMVQICDHEAGMAHCFSWCCDVGPVSIPIGGDEVRTHYMWAFYYTQLKLIISAGNAFFSHHSYVRLSILLVCDILIFVLACGVNVNQFKMHNILRRISIVSAIWTVVCGIIAQIICNPAQWDSFIIWVCGIFVLFVATIIILKRSYSKEYYAELWKQSSTDINQ